MPRWSSARSSRVFSHSSRSWRSSVSARGWRSSGCGSPSSPVTLWRRADGGGGPLVVVAHGYAGSRQMMQAICITLARSGFVVAAFDFDGHGRNPDPMDRDIASLAGATAQLVDQTVAVARAARDLPGVTGPVALVGHSMATDIVIRAADRLDDIAAVVAISMYSEAVTPAFPQRLLIVSGAREGRLREVALDRLRQLDAGSCRRRDGHRRRCNPSRRGGAVRRPCRRALQPDDAGRDSELDRGRDGQGRHRHAATCGPVAGGAAGLDRGIGLAARRAAGSAQQTRRASAGGPRSSRWRRRFCRRWRRRCSAPRGPWASARLERWRRSSACGARFSWWCSGGRDCGHRR